MNHALFSLLKINIPYTFFNLFRWKEKYIRPCIFTHDPKKLLRHKRVLYFICDLMKTEWKENKDNQTWTSLIWVRQDGFHFSLQSTHFILLFSNYYTICYRHWHIKVQDSLCHFHIGLWPAFNIGQQILQVLFEL